MFFSLFLLLIADGWPSVFVCDACVKIIVQFIYGSLHLIRSIFRHDQTENESSVLCEFLCAFFVIFAPVCADGLLHHTVQFIYIHMLKFYEKKRTTTTSVTLNAMHLFQEASVSMLVPFHSIHGLHSGRA